MRDKNDFEYKEVRCKHLFLCIPPEYTLDWNIIKMNLLPLVYSVDTIPLHHIYGYSKNLKKYNNNSFYINTNSELAQIISGDFDNNWFQVSYSSGDNAEYWNRIKLQKPNLFKKLIRKSLKDNKIDIDFTKLESHYWDKAIHYWKPNYNFNINKCVKNSIYPHPINLPNCYWGGEAFSSIQGWIEGSLETCDLVLEALNNNLHNYKLYKQITLKNNEQYLIIDNRYIDVKYWKKVHPGSTAAITNYLGKDVSELFRQIKHTPYSWAMLYTLQKYWFFDNKIIEFI